jgi:tetratricopeptide (TPR) repeat protein
MRRDSIDEVCPMHLKTVFAIALLLSQALPAQAQSLDPAAAASAIEATTARRDNDARQMQILTAGVELVKQRQPAAAIEGYFDKVIASYEATYPAGGKTVYCASSAPESLFYLAQAAKDKKEAIVLGPAWCDAYYLRAYSLIDLGRKDEARATLEKAIAHSPKDPHYLSELANLSRMEKDWSGALAKYEAAVQMAREFAAPLSRTAELGEALRGKGYVLVELGRLEEAEATYKECLAVNAADRTAMAELEYVQAKLQQRKPS